MTNIANFVPVSFWDPVWEKNAMVARTLQAFTRKILRVSNYRGSKLRENSVKASVSEINFASEIVWQSNIFFQDSFQIFAKLLIIHMDLGSFLEYLNVCKVNILP